MFYGAESPLYFSPAATPWVNDQPPRRRPERAKYQQSIFSFSIYIILSLQDVFFVFYSFPQGVAIGLGYDASSRRSLYFFQHFCLFRSPSPTLPRRGGSKSASYNIFSFLEAPQHKWRLFFSFFSCLPKTLFRKLSPFGRIRREALAPPLPSPKGRK